MPASTSSDAANRSEGLIKVQYSMETQFEEFLVGKSYFYYLWSTPSMEDLRKLQQLKRLDFHKLSRSLPIGASFDSLQSHNLSLIGIPVRDGGEFTREERSKSIDRKLEKRGMDPITTIKHAMPVERGANQDQMQFYNPTTLDKLVNGPISVKEPDAAGKRTGDQLHSVVSPSTKIRTQQAGKAQISPVKFLLLQGGNNGTTEVTRQEPNKDFPLRIKRICNIRQRKRGYGRPFFKVTRGLPLRPFSRPRIS